MHSPHSPLEFLPRLHGEGESHWTNTGNAAQKIAASDGGTYLQVLTSNLRIWLGWNVEWRIFASAYTSVKSQVQLSRVQMQLSTLFQK